MKPIPPKRGLSLLTGLAATGLLTAAIFALPVPACSQINRSGRPAQKSQPNTVPRGANPGQDRNTHAPRETVRTREPVPLPQRPANPIQRPASTGRQPINTGRPPVNPVQRPINTGRPPVNAGQRPANTGRPPTTIPGNIGQRTGRTPPITGQTRPRERVQIPRPSGIRAHRTFTKTEEGRRYDNGARLRQGNPIHEAWLRPYFPQGKYHYPYYSPSHTSAVTVVSPFGFYFGVCAPFILRGHSHHQPPVIVYVDVPLYNDTNCLGYPPIPREDNFLDHSYLLEREPGLANAADQLRAAFGRGDMDSLVALIDPNVKIAVFLRGKYEYSLDSNDYLDLAHDAIRSTETIAFDITRIHERAAGVYVLSGEHVYIDADGRTRKVYFSYVVEDIQGVWTLTQVGTAPDRIQEW